MKWLKRHIEPIAQGAIVISSVGMWFTSNGSWVGFAIGLAMQPFWFYTSIKKRQWGVIVASIIFTFSHINGLIHTLPR